MEDFDVLSALLGAGVMFSICASCVASAFKSAAEIMKRAMEFQSEVEALLDENTADLEGGG